MPNCKVRPSPVSVIRRSNQRSILEADLSLPDIIVDYGHEYQGCLNALFRIFFTWTGRLADVDSRYAGTFSEQPPNVYPLICRSHVHEAGPEPNPDVGPKIRILTLDNQRALLLSTFLDNYFISHIVDFLLDHHTSVGNPPFMPNILPLVIFGSPNFLKQRYVLAIFLFRCSPRTPFLFLIVQ